MDLKTKKIITMKKEQLEKANELEELISITGKELKSLHL